MIDPLIFPLFTYWITDENTATPATNLQNSYGLQLTPGRDKKNAIGLRSQTAFIFRSQVNL